MDTKARQKRKTTTTAAILFGIAGGMVGLAFASVPLYQLFCQVTGFGGTPKTDVQAEINTKSPHMGKIVTVRFDANVNKGMPWAF
ncbi:MAG: cytochrome c oxidase assembly protein, partial [Paracoccaceae bacterium]|nr:cytochrome c oxidase assembly protein [Paracoccaceae bacterium]